MHETEPHRPCASLPAYEASLGSQSAAQRSGMDSEARPLRLAQEIWKTNLDLQKQFPNTEFHLELIQFWAVAHLLNSGQ